MDEEIVQQIVDEIFSSLEPLDTQSTALLQFLKAKGIASDEELATYLEQAGVASNVRWLAARVTIKSLISSAMKTEEARPAEQQHEKESAKSSEKSSEPGVAESNPETDGGKKAEKHVIAGAEKNETKRERQPINSSEDTKSEAA